MQQQIRVLQNIVSRKGSSKILSFSIPHIFKALTMLTHQKYVSRSNFCKNLHLGEGAVKTLILHLKEAGFVDSNRSGTFLTEKGQKFSKNIFSVITNNCQIKDCKTTKAKINHAVILRNYSKYIKTGMEQRDFAIMYGATSALTILFQNNEFVFPKEMKDCLENDSKTRQILLKELKPEENDVIVITSANDSFIAEISSINSALWTLATS